MSVFDVWIRNGDGHSRRVMVPANNESEAQLKASWYLNPGERITQAVRLQTNQPDGRAA